MIQYYLYISCLNIESTRNDIQLTTIDKLQNQTDISPICSNLIPCNWELSYEMQAILINNRPAYKSTSNDVIIQYNFDRWEINLDTSTRLSVESGLMYPPNNLYWKLSTNNNIEFQLRIEYITIIDPSSLSGIFYIFMRYYIIIY